MSFKLALYRQRKSMLYKPDNISGQGRKIEGIKQKMSKYSFITIKSETCPIPPLIPLLPPPVCRSSITSSGYLSARHHGHMVGIKTTHYFISTTFIHTTIQSVHSLLAWAVNWLSSHMILCSAINESQAKSWPWSHNKTRSKTLFYHGRLWTPIVDHELLC